MPSTPAQVVSMEDYLAARRQLLEKEKQLTKMRDNIVEERKSLPMVSLKTDYDFTALDADGEKVKKSLADLFDGRKQLIIYHYMFDPNWDAGCPSCTFLAESMNALEHLNSRSVTLVCVSRAPIEKLEAYKKRLGFRFPWVSSYGTDFNKDFHVTQGDGFADQYNFRTKDEHLEHNMPWFTEGEQPGHSCFIMGNSANGVGEDGVVHLTYSSYARAGEVVLPVLHWLDMTKLGRRDEMNNVHGLGFRRHDEYSQDELQGNWKT